MATLPDRLLPSLSVFAVLLFTCTDGSFQKQSNYTCPRFSCGDAAVVVGYPFWQQGERLDHCGYPDFNVSCTDQMPMLRLSDQLFRVKKISYAESTLTLAYGELNDETCPAPSRGVDLSTVHGSLNYTEDDKALHFFYNCTLYPPSVESVKCLQFGAKHGYVFSDGLVPEFDWKGNCESLVTVPVQGKGRNSISGNAHGGILGEGFKLRWRPNGACEACEGTGGFCVYGDGKVKNFSCFCRDGMMHSDSCQNGGTSDAYAAFVAIHKMQLRQQRSESENMGSTNRFP